MKQTAYPCPCGGRLEWKKDHVVVEGIDCGILDIEYCPTCGEEYFPEETMEIVEQKLKEQGLWGVQRKEATLWKSGNSVLLRIPTDIAQYLNLKPDEVISMYTEGKKKLIINV